MRIAVFHNYMDNIGGAEIVGLTLARELKADFYTTNIDEEKIAKMGFSDIKLKSIGSVPINAPMRQQKALWLFRNLNLNGKYDFFIIDGDWAMSGAVNNKPCMWYVYSPIREIWDSYKTVRNKVVPNHLRFFFDAWVRYNRHLNRKYAEHVTRFVCDSKNVQARVKKYLDKDAIVIYPPVETSKYYYKKHKNYWLSVNRLFYHKRVDLQMKAFAKLPKEKLIIVGSYEKSRHFQKYAKHIHSIKPPNVEILSWVSSEKLKKLYAYSKGLIATAIDEDFGLTPIEAMASGKPVIAPNEGGYKETVINGVTGGLIDDISPEALVTAIKGMGQEPEKYRDACVKQAKIFDTCIFIEKIKNIIENEKQ